jgi:hypothetical protein
MPLQIRCPKCNKELAAPDELIGKVAACPGCNTQFPVMVNIRGSAGSILARSAETPAASAALRSASGVTVAAIPSNLPPTLTSAGPQPPPPPDIRRSHADLSISSPAVSNSSVAATPATPPPANANPVQPMPKASQSAVTTKVAREATPAKFIPAGELERINLGSDGLLPELSLQEAQSNESQGGTRSGHPLVLVLVLALSFIASAVLLFLDTESRRTESLNRSMARQELADYYARAASPSHPLEDYQQRLRKALQAHNQGKYADELGYYRQVLNMLRDERIQNDRTAVTGLTGVRKGSTPPSDEHLESLLSQLLSVEGS